MPATAKAEDLIELARSRATSDRERLLLAVADLCDSAGGAHEATVQALLNDVFMALVVEAERGIRKALAERLSTVDWAPKALINVLALDEIEIARPIIARSPLLADADLVRLLVEATVEHQIEVARRPQLGAPVVDAILDRAEPAVLTALAGNTTANIGEEGMLRLVEASRRIASLRSPLVRHPKLSRMLAEQLYAWVGEALKSALTERFRIDPVALGDAVDEAVRAARSGKVEMVAPVLARDGEREEMERRLIAKLQSAGQLRPAYLIRALKERRLTLFQQALATIGGFDVNAIRRACDADRSDVLAFACRAVGIDRAAWPSLVQSVRELNGGLPGAANEAGGRSTADPFRLDPATAAAAFRLRADERG